MPGKLLAAEEKHRALCAAKWQRVAYVCGDSMYGGGGSSSIGGGGASSSIGGGCVCVFPTTQLPPSDPMGSAQIAPPDGAIEGGRKDAVAIVREAHTRDRLAQVVCCQAASADIVAAHPAIHGAREHLVRRGVLRGGCRERRGRQINERGK